MLQEKRIDDYWNVDSSRHLSNSWKGFTQSSFYRKRNLQKDICGPRERLTKIQTTSRPDHVWLEVWAKIGKAAQNRKRNGQKKNQSSTMLEE